MSVVLVHRIGLGSPHGLNDIDALLKDVRRERIERVKREPDKTKLRDALRGKRVIPGAALSNGGTALRITKSRKEVAA